MVSSPRVSLGYFAVTKADPLGSALAFLKCRNGAFVFLLFPVAFSAQPEG